MEYNGSLYGKIGRKYIPLALTSQEVDAAMKQNVVTCVYCGHQYPEGTPTHQAEQLTAHIKICDKHPMRQAEARIKALGKALADLVGPKTKDGLDAMEKALRIMPGIQEDKIAGINAIHVLLAELNAGADLS